jgi:alpha-tubulin suppressor-like RCC1 family protein
VEVLNSNGNSALGDVVAISSGLDNNCAVTVAGKTECWGANASGQLGNGSSANSSAPATVAGIASGVAAIASGNEHTCTATTAGIIQCWGSNVNGQLANGTTRSSAIPVEALGVNNIGVLHLFQ